MQTSRHVAMSLLLMMILMMMTTAFQDAPALPKGLEDGGDEAGHPLLVLILGRHDQPAEDEAAHAVHVAPGFELFKLVPLQVLEQRPHPRRVFRQPPRWQLPHPPCHNPPRSGERLVMYSVDA
jgi:hypothetical protein